MAFVLSKPINENIDNSNLSLKFFPIRQVRNKTLSVANWIFRSFDLIADNKFEMPNYSEILELNEGISKDLIRIESLTEVLSNSNSIVNQLLLHNIFPKFLNDSFLNQIEKLVKNRDLKINQITEIRKIILDIEYCKIRNSIVSFPSCILSKPDDDCIILEWVINKARFGINIDDNPDESFFYFIDLRSAEPKILNGKLSMLEYDEVIPLLMLENV